MFPLNMRSFIDGNITLTFTFPRQAEIDRYHVELRLMLSLDHPNVLTLCGARASPP